MIFIDLETTGLLKASTASLKLQPYITEIYAAKVTKELDFVAEFESFVKPPVPVPEEVVKITGITDAMLEEAPSFIEIARSLSDFFLGEDICIAHNIEFDLGVLCCELRRHDLQYKFPWPSTRVCTVDKSYSIQSRRLNLSKLHTLATGAPHKNAHRAKYDVFALIRCYEWLMAKGYV